jgi:Chaperonin GroEL (HSP60 family)
MTEIEQLEIKDRLDDAIHSLKAAAEGGVVEGGGWTLMQIKKGLEAVIEDLKATNIQESSYKLGYEVVAKSIDAPFNTIAGNAGIVFEESDIIKAINDGTGFNAKTRKFEKLLESGIIDPALVTRSAILNACSIASTWMMSGAGMCISDDDKADPTKNFTESMY